MEQALGIIDQYYQSLFDFNPDAVYLLNMEGRFVSANPACGRILGYSIGELLQSSFFALVILGHLERVWQYFHRAQQGTPQNCEIALIHKKGHCIELNLTQIPIVKDKKVVGVYGIAKDLTGRKRAEEALRISEEKYRTLFEESKDVVFISVPEGKFLDINSAGVELFGYASKEEFLKVDLTNLYLDQEDRWRVERTLAMQGFVKDYELAMKRKDGERLIVLETATAVRNGEGAVVAYRGMMRDVTEQKRLERQLIQAQKMEAVGLLAGGIAHDFNNFLTVILGNIELGLMGIERSHPLYEILTKIQGGALKASALTQKLLAFSRWQMPKPKVVNVAELIGNFSTMLSRLIGEGVELKIDLRKGLGNIYVDPGSLEQVMVNLAVNARDAMPQGGSITIQGQNVYLDEAFRRSYPYVRPGEYVRISVIDTGRGMDEGALQRIFEPFCTPKERGTELELAVAYRIVKQHDGYITVSSQVGRGTRCDIYFSLCKEPLVHEGMEAVVEALPRGKETILMAEDEKEVGEILRAFLEGLGYRVFLACDGEEALKLFSNVDQAFDLVILDAVMPKLSGPKVYDQMRSSCPTLPCLILTGYSEEIVQRYFDQGIEIPMLRKPVTFDEFGRKVREVLDRAARGPLHSTDAIQGRL